MGEHADDALHAGLDEDWNSFRAPYKPKPVTCKRCGKEGLYWGHYPEGYRLQDGIMVQTQAGEFFEWVRHECQLGMKAAFAQMRLDSDPGIAYNAYLDTIPWE